MPITDYAGILIVYTGVGFALFLLVSEFMKPAHRRSALWKAALALTFIQFHNGVLLDGNLNRHPILLIGFLSSVSLTGPIVYSMARSISSPPGKPDIISNWHYILGLAVLVTEVFFLAGENNNVNQATNPFVHQPAQQLFSSVAPIVLIFTGYVLVAGLHLWRINRHYQVRYNRLSSAIFCAAIIATAGTGPGFLWGWRPGFMAGAIVFTLMVMMILLFSIHYPDFFKSVRQEIHRQRYERTALNGIDFEALKQELHQLFEVEQIYRDETLRLVDVARELHVSTNQLSRILNERFGQNFYQFINAYRLAEAARCLLNNRDKKILTIAHEVGFQSKSTFNARFLAEYGMAPSAYRQQSGLSGGQKLA